MIDKKLILYTLLGIVLFALWNAWQTDYPAKPAVPAPTAVTNERSESTVTPAHLAKRPTVSNLGAESISPSAAEHLVKVHTDVLDVTIDLQGGNVVAVALPQYPAVLYQSEPFKLLSAAANKYYVAQSGLLSKEGPDHLAEQALYRTSQQEYRLQSGTDKLEVALVWTNSKGLQVTKKFIFTRGQYDFAVDFVIDNRTQELWSGHFYAQIKRKNFGAKSGLFTLNTYTGAAISSPEIPYEKISFAKIEEFAKEQREIIRENKGGWVAMQQRYFLSTWVPKQTENYTYFSNLHQGIYTIGLSASNIEVPSGSQVTVPAKLYVGPAITENIAPLAPGLDRTVDYGWLWLIAAGFFWFLKKIHSVVGNWGWSIIIMTFLIKLLFYKLSESSGRSMAKMRTLVPKMQLLKERYKDDRHKLHQATMELYKKEKINPLNLGGCLPMLVQIPFFIALYYVLIGAVELRHAPFIFWIHDLSAHDPYYILPILMGLSMFLQQRLTPTTADPAQAKMMLFMPVIFTVFFLNFPAGLVLYWLVNNLLSILQQWHINRKLNITA